MSAVAGLLALGPSTGVSATEEWVSEYQETILVRNSKGLNAGTTLFGLMSRLKSEPAETTEYKWFERDPVTREVYAASSIGTGTTAQFDDGAGNSVYGILQVGTILYHPTTGETLLITAYAAPNYTIARRVQDANASPVSITDNDKLLVVTLGQDEGADPVSAVYEAAGVLYNYVQTFNQTVFLANAFKGSKLRTDIEGPLRDRRVQALERIARDIELAYFLGVRSRQTGTNGWRYFTGGIKQTVDSVSGTPGVLNGGGTNGVSLASIQTWLQSFMTVGSDAKLAFCGPKAYAVFSNFANEASNGFRITGQENVFGMNITMVNTPFGELDLAMHPLFKEISSLNDWMFVLDLALLVQKVMEPLFLEPNIQTPGQDSYKEQFRAKYGLKQKFAQAFGYAKSLQKIV